MTFYILAGNRKEYNNYISGLPQSEKSKCKQVNSLHDIRGLYGQEVALVGSYDERVDWPNFIDYFSKAHFKYKELF